MKVIITIIIALLGFSLQAQNFNELISEGDKLYEEKKYSESAIKYSQALEIEEGHANDYYNAACSWALSNDTVQSINLLNISAEKGFKELSHLKADSDLASLHSVAAWAGVIEKVQGNKEEFEKDFYKPLVAELDSIYQLDQIYRQQIGEIEKKYGQESDKMEAQWALMEKTDSSNLIRIKEILSEKGWLGPKIIGNRGNITLFLVVQHSDLNTQIEYLPMMREAVDQGNARAGNLALLEDRVAMGQGKRQIYGSQMGRDQDTGEPFVFPLIDPEKVNERRAEVGLGTIQDYVRYSNMTWDLEKHKKRTKDIESKKEE